MSAIIQFDLFKEKPSEIEMLKADIAAVGESATKVRKRLFAENNELKKRIHELEMRMEIIERNICKGLTHV
jgi:uncharacterized protein YdcH (DUF465 family)